jgi:hypothetical protein
MMSADFSFSIPHSGECAHFDGERNHCRAQRNETTRDTPAYRFFDLRAAALEAGLDDKEDATARKAPCPGVRRMIRALAEKQPASQAEAIRLTTEKRQPSEPSIGIIICSEAKLRMRCPLMTRSESAAPGQSGWLIGLNALNPH